MNSKIAAEQTRIAALVFIDIRFVFSERRLLPGEVLSLYPFGCWFSLVCCGKIVLHSNLDSTASVQTEMAGIENEYLFAVVRGK